MKKLQPSTQYRKDLKRYKRQPQKLAALKVILEMLQNDQSIPTEYFPHILHGIYNGCMECHIQGDFLLIWIDENRGIIELVRFGSHAMLFGR